MSYISLHPNYFKNEGFGTLMSHYAVMYNIYKDLTHEQAKPCIIYWDISRSYSDNMTAMKIFNQFNEPILYHEHAFPNINNSFTILDNDSAYNIDWSIIDLREYTTYNDILTQIKQYNNYNLLLLWNLNSQLVYHNILEIKNYLYKFDDNIIYKSKNILPKTNKEIVAVCVRTEYEKINSGHTRLSLNFYQKAMSLYDRYNTKFLFFSDDIELTKQRFRQFESELDIEYTKPMPSAIGMCAMSLCDHIICANSSFSYWASILNNSINAKIICPCKFIEDQFNPILNLNYKWYPKNWIAIDIV